MKYWAIKLTAAALLLSGCANFSIEDTEIKVSDFVKRVSQEIQVYFYLNEQAGPQSIGLCLSAVEVSVLATISDSSPGSLGLTLGDLTGSNLGLTPGATEVRTRTRNYSFKFSPDYSSKMAKKDEMGVTELIQDDDYNFADALMKLKLALLDARPTYAEPVFGPPLVPSSVVAKFQFNVVKKSNGKVVLTVISTGLIGKSVLNADEVDTETNDATATVKFERAAKDGICRNAPSVSTPGQVITPAPDPDVIFSPLSPPLSSI